MGKPCVFPFHSCEGKLLLVATLFAVSRVIILHLLSQNLMVISIITATEYLQGLQF